MEIPEETEKGDFDFSPSESRLTRLNFHHLLWIQMNRINYLATLADGAKLSSAVDFLEALLTPYIDADYADDVRSAQRSVAALFRKRTDGSILGERQAKNSAALRAAKLKYRALCSLMGRCGLLPEHVAVVDSEASGDDNAFKLLCSRVRERLLKKNQNWLCLIVGAPATGKSYVGLRIAEEIDPDFSIENVASSASAFMSVISSGKLKKGSAVLFDEVGVGLAAREWQSFVNVAVGKILQTFRVDNIAVIFTAPDPSFVDIQARRLFHSFIETTRSPSSRLKRAFVRWYNLQRQPRLGKTYFVLPRWRNSAGQLCRLSEIRVGLPSQKLVDAYEKMHVAFKQKLKLEIGKQIADTEEKQKSLVEIAEIVASDPERFSIEGMLSPFAVALHFALGQRDSKRVVDYARAKMKEKEVATRFSDFLVE